MFGQYELFMSWQWSDPEGDAAEGDAAEGDAAEGDAAEGDEIGRAHV